MHDEKLKLAEQQLPFQQAQQIKIWYTIDLKKQLNKNDG